MGLDFSHCNARWPYSGFHRFRKKLAATIGITLDDMIGFGGHVPWDGIKDDIALLLNHSDCDGILTPQECEKVAPRLVELISQWQDDDCDKIIATTLAEGMLNAASLNENLEFC